ncbi:VOC family protein [Thalassospiraceae bacterium LMO-JJ14]|nr:VOC family protein [Thalassospiraceae bacterium LMO-JJ14]
MPRGIDHLVLCVNDLKKARAQYEKLGFTMTPEAQHPFGTGNTLAQLDGCFLEVLAVTKPEDITEAEGDNFSFAAFNRDFLQHGEGMSMLVLDSTDEVADRNDFKSKGLHVYAPFDFQRLAKLPDGSDQTVGFSLTFTADASLPDMGFFTCKQWRPDLFWKEEYQRHANGAACIDEVFIVAPDPVVPTAFLAAFADSLDIASGDGFAKVVTTRGKLGVYTPAAFDDKFPGAFPAKSLTKPSFTGFAIETADPGAAAALWSKNGFDVQGGGKKTWLGPCEGMGCVIAAV